MQEKGLKRLAIVGGGVSGIAAAYLLQRVHNVVLFEKNDYVGGHTHTVEVSSGPDQGLPVDTGFIVLNDRTYPNFMRFLEQLGVSIQPTDMSFSYFDRTTGFQYAGTDLNSVFAQRANALRPGFWLFLFDILRFNSRSKRSLSDGSLRGKTLGDYLKQQGFSEQLIHRYILPMGAAIWSTPRARMMEFPAESFLRFCDNHGLLDLRGRPQWYFIPGGSRTYVRRFLESFRGETRVNCPVQSIKRRTGGVTVRLPDGSCEDFDAVVIAAHANEALNLLEDPHPEEARLLSRWQYNQNRVVLHTDASFLPPLPRACASWNYVRERNGAGASPVTLTYSMNRLQKLQAAGEYCVTLNAGRPVARDSVIRSLEYTHPLYSFEALETQEPLRRLNGLRSTFFCGAYLGYGFHEDGFKSGLEVAAHFGVRL
jgi:predicted NAD/FAD-binding protein